MRCTLSSASDDEWAGLSAWKSFSYGHLYNEPFVFSQGGTERSVPLFCIACMTDVFIKGEKSDVFINFSIAFIQQTC